MKRKRTLPLIKDYPVAPFLDAEEAWFWFSRCQNLRALGGCTQGDAPQFVRPCEPDDVYRIVRKLERKGLLHKRHIRVLGKFGSLETPPDPRSHEEEPLARLWEEALDRLTTPFKLKGIINAS